MTAVWPLATLQELAVEGPTNGYSPPASPGASGTWSLRLSATTQGRLVLNDRTVKRLRETIPEDSWAWLEPGDLLVQRANTAQLVGTAALYDGPARTYIYPDLMMRLRFAHEATARWVWRYLNSPAGRGYVSAMAAGAAGSMPKISGAKLRAMPVPVPPLAEQRRIADLLDQADAVRRRCAEAIALTAELLRSTFLDLFGDPLANPRGWPVTALGDLAPDLRYGTSARCTTDRPEGSLPVLRIPNIAPGAIDLTDLKYALLPPAEVDRLLLRHGDLLLVRSNGNPDLLGRCAVHDADAPSLFASYLIRARPLGGLSMSTYLQGALSSRSYRHLLARSARTTAGNYNLSAASLRRLRIPCPPPPLLDRYLALSGQIRDQRARFERARLESAALFDAVTRRAFQDRDL